MEVVVTRKGEVVVGGTVTVTLTVAVADFPGYFRPSEAVKVKEVVPAVPSATKVTVLPASDNVPSARFVVSVT